MALCNINGGFLFQVLPDLFPYALFGNDEATLWGRFHEERNRMMKAQMNG
ncbi:MAG: hypothetical protein HQL56_01180 [Magnetococcales bacterium]|nr:hypothetical protein [Magnetococcales bacterium]